MSWRILVMTLLVALGVSAWGGVQLGDWLVQHAPQAAPAPGADDDGAQAVLDANGKPYLAQPPQPRVDGTLGVPDKPTAANWNIQTVSLFEVVKDPNVTLSRSSMTAGQAAEIARAARSSLPDGDNNDSALDTAPAYGQGAIMASSSFSSGTMIRSSAQSSGANNGNGQAGGGGNWLPELRNELAQCANAGFFERPTCAWNARNRYCGPNQAWGRVNECPQRP